MTSVTDLDKAIGPYFPQGYGRAALGPVRAEPPAAPGWLYAAGELSMTPTDLAKWDIARMNRAFLPADDWDEQERTVKLADGKDIELRAGRLQPDQRWSPCHQPRRRVRGLSFNEQCLSGIEIRHRRDDQYLVIRRL